MVNKTIGIILFSAVLCFFQYSKVYCQVTTPEQYKQIRANREARERRDREDRKVAEERIKNTKVTPTITSTKESANTSKAKGLGCDGNCKDGYGTYRYDKNQTYFGNWKNGKKEGIGEMWYPDGSYKGDWKNDLFDGTGTRIYIGTSVYDKNVVLKKYTGEWKEGKRSGKGEEIHGDKGDIYSGNFLNDRFVYGKVKFYRGEVYIGAYDNNGRSGFGTTYNSSGKIAYSGEYKNHYQHGKGTATTDDGIYKGIWKEGKLDIVESITNLDGSPKVKEIPIAMGCLSGNCVTGTGQFRDASFLYSGEWIGGKKNGAGVLTSGNFVYTGNFVNDLFEGKGVLKYPDQVIANDSKYEGMFKAGKFDGEGILTDKAVQIYSGQFRNGLFHGKGKSKHPDNSIKYDGDFVDGFYDGFGILYNEKWNSADQYKNYEGYFKRGKCHGSGKKYAAFQHMRLEGNWVNGSFGGTGVLYKEDGTVFYSGSFAPGYIPLECIGNCQNGTGQKFDPNSGNYYTGGWKDGKWHGMGKECEINGSPLFEGQFRDGIRHGKGVSYGESHAHHLECNWVEGKKQGKGILYYADGNGGFASSKGLFENDRLIKFIE